jgi:hypothetical protein
MSLNARGLQRLTENVQYVCGATGAAIAAERGNEMVCVATSGLTAPPLESCVQTNSSLSGECLRTGQILRCDSIETDTRVDVDSCRQLGIESILVLPLFQNGKVAGLLQLLSMQPRAFQDRDVAAAKRIAQIAETLLSGNAAFAQTEVSASVPSPRRWARVQLGVPVTVTTLRSGVPEEIPGRSLDICEKGMGVILAAELPTGEGGLIEFLLPLASNSVRRRSIVRHHDGLRHGFEFLDQMPEQATEQREYKLPMFMLPKIIAGQQ